MSTIFKESDVITGKTEQEILDIMGSDEKSLEGSGIIDEDNRLFYVDGDLVTINHELIDYYISDLYYGEITHDDIKSNLSVYYYDYDYYAVWHKKMYVFE